MVSAGGPALRAGGGLGGDCKRDRSAAGCPIHTNWWRELGLWLQPWWCSRLWLLSHKGGRRSFGWRPSARRRGIEVSRLAGPGVKPHPWRWLAAQGATGEFGEAVKGRVGLAAPLP